MAEPNTINPFEEDIKANELEATALAQEFQPEPYAQTRLAQQEEMKSWRQMLIDSHKKREEERTKRLRSEQILGIGKALGDLLGAAFAGAGSLRGNYAAVVPQAQAPKSVERVQQLINEGVVNAQDYDKMMQTLAMQEGKDRIALAKAMDELGIKQSQLAEQREYGQQKIADQRNYEQAKAKVAHERQKELRSISFANQSSLLAKKGENALAIVKAKKDGDKNPSNNKFTDGDKAILGAVIPETITKEGKYGEVEVPNKPTTNQLTLTLARQKDQMKQYNLNPDKEEDKEKWAIAISSIGELATRLPQASKEQLLAALISGLTGEEIITMWNARFGNNGAK